MLIRGELIVKILGNPCVPADVASAPRRPSWGISTSHVAKNAAGIPTTLRIKVCVYEMVWISQCMVMLREGNCEGMGEWLGYLHCGM